MTLKTLIQKVLDSHRLTRRQQETINTVLRQQRFTEEDIQALDRLTDAVLDNRVQVEDPNFQPTRVA